MIIVLTSTAYLLSCTHTQDVFEQEVSEQDFSELLAVRAKPAGISELEYECICMDDEINKINTFTEKMNNSKFAVFYQAMGREKVTVINDHKNTIKCQQFDGNTSKINTPQDYPAITEHTDYTATTKLRGECKRLDNEIIELSTLEISKSKFTMHYKELKQDMIQTIKNHKNAINCQQFD